MTSPQEVVARPAAPSLKGNGPGVSQPVWRRYRLLVPTILLAAEAVLLCVLHVGSFVELSPVDELMHFDNLVRMSSPDLVPDSADPLHQETLRELACRAEHGDAWNVAPSGAACIRLEQDPADFSWRGLNPSVGHVPLYYLVTGAGARLMRLVVPSWGLLTSARLLGAAWAVLGCYLALRAADAIGAGRRESTAALALVLAVPSQLTAMTMVNPDAALLAVGGSLLLLVVKIAAGSLPAWSLVPAAAVAMLFDPSASIAVLFAVGYLAAEALRCRGLTPVAIFRIASLVAGTAVTAAAVMTVWSSAVAAASDVGDFSGSPQDGLYRVDDLPLSRILGEGAVFALLPPTDQPHEPSPLRDPGRSVFVQLSRLLLVAGAVSALLRDDGRTAALGGAVLGALLAAAPLMILRNYITSRWYFEIPNRYGISALPVLALLLAVAASSRAGQAVVVVVATGLVATTTLALT